MNKIIKIEGQNLKLTHLDKILWPKEKISKADLIDYYKKIAKDILPYLKNRPVTVEKCPNGIEKECWIQKDAPENLPKFVKIFKDTPKTTKEKVNYILVNNLATLLWLANLDSIEFHIWLSKVNNLQKPDWIIFDLDLTKDAKFSDIVRVAFLFKEELEKLKFPSFLKTSGKSGLHILAPNKAADSYFKTRKLVKEMVFNLDKKYPDLIATEARIAARKGRIFIDAAQNSKGRTMICPYSVRATEKATVSAPIKWSELKGINPEDFNIKTMPKRAREHA